MREIILNNTSEREGNFMFKFITTNQEKIVTARRHLTPLGISFQETSLDLTEIQTTSVVDIVKAKAREAYEKIREPLVVSDHSWNIPALNGFPGPYMKYINEWLSTEDFLALTKRHDDHRIIKTEAVCFTDGTSTQVFTSDLEGVILETPRGNGLPTMRVVSMRNDGKTVAECIEEEIDITDEYRIWEEFAEWYKQNKKE